MASLNTWCYFSLDSGGGETTGKQGSTTDAPQVPFPITVDGYVHKTQGIIADDAIGTIWDEDEDSPVDFSYCHIWTDQDCFLQVIMTATSFTIPILAKVPFTLAGNTGLGAASTTPMTAGVAPSVTAIDSLILSNLSGSAMNFVATFVD